MSFHDPSLTFLWVAGLFQSILPSLCFPPATPGILPTLKFLLDPSSSLEFPFLGSCDKKTQTQQAIALVCPGIRNEVSE